ncbi:hypothetical protein ACHAWF_004124 [Thalassiosira exigua]
MPRTTTTPTAASAAAALLLLSHLLLPLPAADAFTEAALHRLAQASSLSYLPLDKIPSSEYYPTCRLEPVAQAVDPSSESGATIFRSSREGGAKGGERGKLVVACRGSANPKNFGTNLKFNLVPADRLSQDSMPDNALVHEGFQTASLGLWKELSRPLLDHVLECDEVIFTGHSLGAATALLCATHYNASFRGSQSSSSSSTNPPPPSVVSFGGPKLCNAILARHLRNIALEGCTILDVVHSRDPILANNEKLWDERGFERVGIEVECDPHRPVVRASREFGTSSSSPFGNFAWNVLDHCKYMGVFVGPRALL